MKTKSSTNEPLPASDLFGTWQPMESAPKDSAILVAWGTDTRGAMGYDIVKYAHSISEYRRKWESVISGDRLPLDGYLLIGWMPLPALTNNPESIRVHHGQETKS